MSPLQRFSLETAPIAAVKQESIADQLSLDTLQAGEYVIVPSEQSSTYAAIRTYVWRYNKRKKSAVSCQLRDDGSMMVLRPPHDTSATDPQVSKLEFLRSMQPGQVQYVGKDDTRESLQQLIADVGPLERRFLKVGENNQGLFIGCIADTLQP